MDRGSSINVLYTSTLEDMGIPRSKLRPSTAPFHGVVKVEQFCEKLASHEQSLKHEQNMSKWQSQTKFMLGQQLQA
jgi:hypothetical protein